MPSDESTIEVYAIGSQVLLDGRISAHIVAVQIERSEVSYKCAWWNELTRHVEWFSSWEVMPDGDKARQQRVNPIL